MYIEDEFVVWSTAGSYHQTPHAWYSDVRTSGRLRGKTTFHGRVCKLHHARSIVPPLDCKYILREQNTAVPVCISTHTEDCQQTPGARACTSMHVHARACSALSPSWRNVFHVFTGVNLWSSRSIMRWDNLSEYRRLQQTRADRLMGETGPH